MADWKSINGYELVAGLEVHVELKTRTKAFCGCPTTYGAPPNSQCCPVCMGYPGALPVLNQQAVHFAALAGMALGCTVATDSKMDRKHYFYPDLPKAYQVSQFDQPLCTGGYLDIETPSGAKRVGITRIHLEEDAGKLLHENGATLLDCNRCGVPLIEIVSQPDIRTPQEAVTFLKKLRTVLLYTGISDCRMNEGSLRCDVNLSVRQPGQPMGIRTEMKNLNSFQSVQRAMAEEYRRQVEALQREERIVQETRRFDQGTGCTYPMRRKEDAGDYRFMPEPDLPAIHLSAQQLAAWRKELPVLPDARKTAYMQAYGLTSAAAEQLAGSLALANYFEEAAAATHGVKILVSLMITEVFRLLEDDETPPRLPPAHLAKIADMVADGEINGGSAKKMIAALWACDQEPEAFATQHGLLQLSDEQQLAALVEQAMQAHGDMVAKYHAGKVSMKKALMGAAMGLCGGRANPVLLQRLLDAALDKPLSTV